MSDTTPFQTRTQEEVLAASPKARAFHAGGGYELVEKLGAVCRAAGLSHAIIVQLFDDETPDDATALLVDGRANDDACLAVQVAVMAAGDRFEDILQGLAAELALPLADEPLPAEDAPADPNVDPRQARIDAVLARQGTQGKP